MKFKGRNCLSSQGEAASGDVETAASHPEDLAKIIHEGGCTKQQAFNGDKQPYTGRRCHLGLSSSERRKSMPGFKASKDRLTLVGGLMYLVTLN